MSIKNININEFAAWVAFSITPLFCVNFLNRQWVFAAMLALCGLVVFVVNANKVTLSIQTIVALIFLLGFVISYYYMCYSYNFERVDQALQGATYIIAAFLTGYFVTRVSQKHDFLIMLLFMIIVGHLIYVCLSLYRTFEIYGSIEIKIFVSFWDENQIIYGTNGTSPSNLAAAVFASVFVPYSIRKKRSENATLKKELLLRIIALVCGFVALSTSIMGGSRTGIVVVACSILFAQIYLLVFTKHGKNSMLLLCAALLVVALVYYSEAFGVKKAVENSYLLKRVEQIQTKDTRAQTWAIAFRGLFENPFGGRKTNLKGLFFAHNMWLDVGYKAGLVPFVCSVGFFAMVPVVFLRFKKTQENIFYVVSVLCVFFAYIISFFVEPVMDGYLSMFFSMCILFGALCGKTDAHFEKNKKIIKQSNLNQKQNNN